LFKTARAAKRRPEPSAASNKAYGARARVTGPGAPEVKAEAVVRVEVAEMVAKVEAVVRVEVAEMVAKVAQTQTAGWAGQKQAAPQPCMATVRRIKTAQAPGPV
jgi:hypothetical protein